MSNILVNEAPRRIFPVPQAAAPNDDADIALFIVLAIVIVVIVVICVDESQQVS
jgi:hypothetical protein